MYWTSPVTGAFSPQQLEEGAGHCLCVCGHPGPRPVRPTKRDLVLEEKKKEPKKDLSNTKKANLGPNLHSIVFTELIFKLYNHPLSYFHLVY